MQSKDCKDRRWAEWFTQLEEQRRNAKADHAWLVVKRPGIADARQGLAVMTVEAHARLLHAAGYGTAGVATGFDAAGEDTPYVDIATGQLTTAAAGEPVKLGGWLPTAAGTADVVAP